MDKPRDVISITEGKKFKSEKPIDLMPMVKFIGLPLTLAAVLAAHTALFFAGANREKKSSDKPVAKSALGEALNRAQEMLDAKDPRKR